MTVAEFTPIVFIAALLAGFLGSLTGLGGGVIVTSSGAAAAYVRDGYSNIRIGMFLEIATILGALFGVLFGLILLQAAWQTSRARKRSNTPVSPDPLAKRLRLNGAYTTDEGLRHYEVHRVKTGFGLMLGAGVISGLLGIGSGSLKVVAMDQAMQLPFKVSTATSNFMIGVTAAASASIYLSRGYINPAIAMPVMLGVLAGSIIGARYLARLSVPLLRKVFAIVVGLMAIEMILNGVTGRV
jgi:uncharacterized protein